MEVGNDGVAVITFSNPPLNVLAASVISGLKVKFGAAMDRQDVKAIVLTGQGRNFCGGLDINFFQIIQRTGDTSILPDVSIDLVTDTIEDATKPVVAAIQGLAFGGGLELAMGCHARVAATGAELCLPELTLGIIPGAGGTQRLPRLVGLSKAIEILMSSKPVSPDEGKELGLIDDMASPADLLGVSRRWALDIAKSNKPWTRTLHRMDKIGSLSETRNILKAAREQAQKTSPNMPQHQASLDMIEEGIVRGGYFGSLKEAKVSKDLILSDTSRGLVHVFFAQRAISKVPGVTDLGLKPRAIKKVAIIGGGQMGSGIATALLVSNIHVLMKEVDSENLQRGMKMVEGSLQDLVRRKILANDDVATALSKFKGVLDYSEFNDVDMVIEAVFENIPLKQSIYSDIEKLCPPHCILATNTSTIDLHVVGERTKSQDRIIGAHFFGPAHLMPLLEIVRTEKTSSQVILDLMTLGKIIKKVPVIVGNCAGFAVNRTFFPYTQGAHLLAHLGIDVFRIDRIISNFGLPMGPFQLEDLGGYNLAMAAEKQYVDTFGDRTFVSPLLRLFVKYGRIGKKNGKGYYVYQKGSKPKPDPAVIPIIEESRKIANVMPGGKPISVTDKEVLEMMLFPVVNEACRVVDEGVVVRTSDLDIASVRGMSFPSYRGGIVFWADTVGPKRIYTSLKKWSELYGNFYKPSKFLEERALQGIPLSAPAPTSSSSNSRL